MTVSCPKDLSTGHLNIYHLANKVTDVNVFVHQSDILHIFGLSESKLTSYVSDEVVSIPNYSILRRDADEPGQQGSRCMFIVLFGNSLIGAMIWNLRMSKAFGFRSKQEETLLSSYPSFIEVPTSTLVWFDEFVVMMDRVQNGKHHNEILLLGDFNIDMFKPNPARVSTLSLFNLHQCVQSPTRVTSTTSTLTDLIYIYEQS